MVDLLDGYNSIVFVSTRALGCILFQALSLVPNRLLALALGTLNHEM